MSDKIAEDLVDGQRVVLVKSVEGDALNNSELLTEVVVDLGNGVYQRCVAVKDFGGGGGGGGSVDYSRVIEKSNSIPTASATYNHRMYIYGGETNETYTHGYIYECKQKTIYTGTVSFNPASISGTVVSCSGDDFANFLTESGVSPLTVVSGTITYDASGNMWTLVGKDANNNTVMTFQEYTEDYEDLGFTFTGTYVNGDVVSFTCTVSEGSSTYAWERIDVQPAGGVGGVEDVQINGTSIVTDGVANIPVSSQDTLGVSKVSPTYGLTVSNGTIVGSTKTESVYSTAADSLAICKGTLSNIQNTYVRSVLPACTTITSADTTATLVANSTYAHQPATGCTYTLTTPTDLTVYSGFILMIDTTNSASIAFQTDDSPATTISISGSPTIEVGKKYTVTGQWDVVNSNWQLFIISYETS